MTSTSFEPGWQWPESLPGRWTNDEDDNTGFKRSPAPSSTAGTVPGENDSANRGDSSQHRRRRTHYPPRQCRICLEVVQPSYETPSENIPEFLQGMPSVSYVSEDGGRLIRPCLCKGSQKYVHEGCLTLWRLQDPTQKRNYWQCPTCKYNYRLGRMTWAHWVGSSVAQVALTIAIVLVVIFMLGYVADPILNFFIDADPVINSGWDDHNILYQDDDINGWFEHFMKGLASLGLLGFAKIIVTMNPFAIFNYRSSGMMGVRSGNTGRQRLQNIGWLAVIVGVVTFLWVSRQIPPHSASSNPYSGGMERGALVEQKDLDSRL